MMMEAGADAPSWAELQHDLLAEVFHCAALRPPDLLAAAGACRSWAAALETGGADGAQVRKTPKP
jgi:hypothetical protein